MLELGQKISSHASWCCAVKALSGFNAAEMAKIIAGIKWGNTDGIGDDSKLTCKTRT